MLSQGHSKGGSIGFGIHAWYMNDIPLKKPYPGKRCLLPVEVFFFNFLNKKLYIYIYIYDVTLSVSTPSKLKSLLDRGGKMIQEHNI
jgi:hypothetical protein